MADVKTNLRELSVIVGIYKIIGNIEYNETPKSFTEICDLALPSETKEHYTNIAQLKVFKIEEQQIIKNGFNLAKRIIEKFDICRIDEINWYGYLTVKDEPYDISVNGIKFSLKEESFILENMGLYKLLNCFTGSSYKKCHIFKDYAPKEYSEWFCVSWNEMIKILLNSKNAWRYKNPQKKKDSVIYIVDETVVLEYYVNNILEAKSILPKKCDLNIFEEKTNSIIREQVFAKFINKELDNNIVYNKIKKKCAIVATDRLADELCSKLNYHSGLPRFLRIHQSEYYYAKTTADEVKIYKVPSLNNFTNDIVIDSIVGSVPQTQANILTTIRNKKTGGTLVLRNECRFSHGQFNGTPEAKMYYESGGSLLVIYESV